MLSKKQLEAVRPYTQHGVTFTKMVGNEAVGMCPFTHKPDKFYVNVTNLMFDAKAAGESGNLTTFLTLMHKTYMEDMTPHQWKKLTENRRIPKAAFDEWDIGWTGDAFALPMYTKSGNVMNIRLWKPSAKGMFSTARCNLGLYGFQHLHANPDLPAFICEGEWDAMALDWVLMTAGVEAVVVGVPGALTFNEQWPTLFRNREVTLMYDADEPGRKGASKAFKLLRGNVNKLRVLHWPDETPDGWDVRDEIVDRVGDEKLKSAKAKTIYKSLMGWLRDFPPVLEDGEGTEVRETKYGQPPDLAEVRRVFNKWLYLENTDAVEVCLATVVSQELEGDPLWMFIVAPPGGSKTEHVQAFDGHYKTMMTSSLTPKTLLSGAILPGGADPSLLPKLDRKTLIVKDFTSIISMREQDREEIFGILRDAYDGKAGRDFGNGIKRTFKGTFSILAGVTPIVYALSASHVQLGERFLKFRIGSNLHHHNEREILRRALQNSGKETSMRAELQDVILSFMDRHWNEVEEPEMPAEMEEQLISLSQFGGRCRGTLVKHGYRDDMVLVKASSEVPARLIKQLKKIGRALSMVRGDKVISEDTYRIIRKVMLDTLEQRVEDIIRTLFLGCETRDDQMTINQLSDLTGFPKKTLSSLLGDMYALEIVETGGDSFRKTYRLTDFVYECIVDSKLYTTAEEQQRPKEEFKVEKKKRVRKVVTKRRRKVRGKS